MTGRARVFFPGCGSTHPSVSSFPFPTQANP
jgi:hypothetical protein